MDAVSKIVNSLNKEEVRFFKLYASRMDTGERKDLKLFDYIRKNGESYDEEKVFLKLYGKGEKNAFYRLRNRLMTDLNKCLLMQHFNEEETLHALNLFSLARFYTMRSNTSLAVYFLKKASTKASEIENYELLDLVYGEFIRLSHDVMEINPEQYIEKRKENQERIRQLRAIDDVVAVLSYRLKITQNFSKGDQSVIGLLQKTVDDFSHDHSLSKSPKFRFRIYTAVSQILLQKRDYKALEEYLLRTFKEFTKLGFFNKNNHDTKLQILTYIVNSLFKNDKLKQSLQYTSELHKAMEEFNRMLYEKYQFFYYNSLVINYSKLDKEKAIAVLEDIRENQKMAETPFYGIFVYLNLAVLHFDLQQFRESIRFLSKLYLLDSYKNADKSLQMKISVAELMVRFELKDLEYLDYRIRRIRKDYRELLKKEEYAKEKEFLNILSVMSFTRNIAARVKKIKNFIQQFQSSGDSDDEIISYSNWLKDKSKTRERVRNA